jgi:hypothetical protein
MGLLAGTPDNVIGHDCLQGTFVAGTQRGDEILSDFLFLVVCYENYLPMRLFPRG